MDGENNGSKPYEQMDDLGGKNHPYFWGRDTHIFHYLLQVKKNTHVVALIFDFPRW